MNDNPLRIIRADELKDKVGYSIMTVWRLERDGKFPKRIQLGAGAVGWIESEVDAWIAARMAERAA
jgi:prophage regulatory protein